ncbi:MAG: Cys-tRNA(Pro) deacylase, partial [Nitriliruptoraceae bacterium]
GSATPATRALDAAAVAYRLHAFTHDPQAERFGEEAVEALGADPARVGKTLVVIDEGGERRSAVVGVDGRLDLKALAAAAGVKRVGMADVADAERVTGYVHGGISPFGQRRRLATVVDADLAAHDRVIVNGGRRGLQVELTPADLVALTGATVAPIRR